MTEEQMIKRLGEMVATVELAVDEWNLVVNYLNMPSQMQTILAARLIDALSAQIGPQVTKAKTTLEAIKNADGVDKTLEEKN